MCCFWTATMPRGINPTEHADLLRAVVLSVWSWSMSNGHWKPNHKFVFIAVIFCKWYAYSKDRKKYVLLLWLWPTGWETLALWPLSCFFWLQGAGDTKGTLGTLNRENWGLLSSDPSHMKDTCHFRAKHSEWGKRTQLTSCLLPPAWYSSQYL